MGAVTQDGQDAGPDGVADEGAEAHARGILYIRPADFATQVTKAAMR